MLEVVHHSIYISRHRAGLVGVLHGWVGMQTASRHSPAPDPAPGQLSACNTVVPTQERVEATVEGSVGLNGQGQPNLHFFPIDGAAVFSDGFG